MDKRLEYIIVYPCPNTGYSVTYALEDTLNDIAATFLYLIVEVVSNREKRAYYRIPYSFCQSLYQRNGTSYCRAQQFKDLRDNLSPINPLHSINKAVPQF